MTTSCSPTTTVTQRRVSADRRSSQDRQGRPFTIPRAELAVTVHHGPHDDIDVTYGALGTYVTEHALAISGPVRETYLIGPRDTQRHDRVADRNRLADLPHRSPMKRFSTPDSHSRAVCPSAESRTGRDDEAHDGDTNDQGRARIGDRGGRRRVTRSWRTWSRKPG